MMRMELIFWRAVLPASRQAFPASEFEKASPHPSLPLAGFPQFADPAFDQVPLEHAEVLDK
jgi:hypothetical protein